jgi:lysosomal acid lipase/cholesteryl ester hydrolase
MEENLTLVLIASKYGMGFEQYKVVTEDNYILQVMHIYAKILKPESPVVFLQHGLFSCADVWVLNGELSPAFILANEGFDVWLGNNRGNVYSRSHKWLCPDKQSAAFFDYSFSELA